MKYIKFKNRPEVFLQNGAVWFHVTNPNNVVWKFVEETDFYRFIVDETNNVYAISDAGYRYINDPKQVDWKRTLSVAGLTVPEPVDTTAPTVPTISYTPLSQTDPRWAKKYLPGTKFTIGDYGCFVTAIGIIIGATPDWVAITLFQNGGLVGGGVVSAVAARVFGMKYDPDRANHKFWPVIARTDYYANSSGYKRPYHFFVMINDNTIVDPLGGQVSSNKYASRMKGYRNLSK